MTDQSYTSDLLEPEVLKMAFSLRADVAHRPLKYVVFKFVCDKSFAAAALPFVACIAVSFPDDTRR